MTGGAVTGGTVTGGTVTGGTVTGGAVSREELESAHCWEADDRVPGRPEMTEFRRRARLHQARWRAAHGHPIGTQPIVPVDGRPARQVGSRLPLVHARETGANFVTEGALAAARERTAITEPHQTLDHQRLWADLLWSPSLGFNLFGELAADPALADRAVHTWWPEAPGTVCEVRFAHSPGRFAPAYLNSLRAFDAAFVLDLGDGSRGVLGVDTRYADWAKPETPKPSNLERYREVAERSGAFAEGAIERLAGRSGLCELWLEHLLLLSMLQHESGRWRWGRFVVVHPAGNVDYAEATEEYAGLLADRSTFATATLEEILDAAGLPPATATAVRERYVVR
jgi:hypothetical protein